LVNIGKREDSMAKSFKSVGLIAEDKSDIESLSILIKRICNTSSINIKGVSANGCGMLRRKCKPWADQLKIKGCEKLVVVHDLDRNDQKTLHANLVNTLNSCPFKSYLICIPVEEIEAWLLADVSAIKKVLNLKVALKEIFHPELVKSPKEHLYRLVEKTSSGEKYFIHTIHNPKIFEFVDIGILAKKCPSFKLLYNFFTKK